MHCEHPSDEPRTLRPPAPPFPAGCERGRPAGGGSAAGRGGLLTPYEDRGASSDCNAAPMASIWALVILRPPLRVFPED